MYALTPFSLFLSRKTFLSGLRPISGSKAVLMALALPQKTDADTQLRRECNDELVKLPERHGVGNSNPCFRVLNDH